MTRKQMSAINKHVFLCAEQFTEQWKPSEKASYRKHIIEWEYFSSRALRSLIWFPGLPLAAMQRPEATEVQLKMFVLMSESPAWIK